MKTTTLNSKSPAVQNDASIFNQTTPENGSDADTEVLVFSTPDSQETSTSTISPNSDPLRERALRPRALFSDFDDNTLDLQIILSTDNEEESKLDIESPIHPTESNNNDFIIDIHDNSFQSIANRILDNYELRVIKACPSIGYDLELMSSLDNISNAKESTVYLNENTKVYFVKGMDHALGLPENIDLTDLDQKLNDADFKKIILAITSNAGHTPSINDKFNKTTFITPQGVYQLNQEINEFKCLISADEFKATHGSLLLNRAEHMIAVDGELINHEISLTQLNLLESSLRLNHGHTIIGYTVNEEIYIRIINAIINAIICILHAIMPSLPNIPAEYPPAPKDYSRRMLETVSQPIVFDVAASLRVTLQTYLLLTYFISAYIQYKNDDVDNILLLESNAKWRVVGFSVATTLIFLLLRSGFFEKKFALKSIESLKNIEQSTLGFGKNWMNYGVLIMPETILNYGVFPVLLLGAIKGYFKKDSAIINIKRFTALQTVEKSFFSALTVGSFAALGLSCLINSFCFLYQNTDDPTVLAQYNADVSIAQYSAFSIMFLLSIMQYPYLPNRHQYIALYSSNIMNGITYTLLDFYILFGFVEQITSTLSGQKISPDQEGILAIYLGLQALIFLSSLLITFPTTKNLSTFSIEKTSNKKNDILTKIYQISIDFMPWLHFKNNSKITKENESHMENKNPEKLNKCNSFFYKKNNRIVNIEIPNPLYIPTSVTV